MCMSFFYYIYSKPLYIGDEQISFFIETKPFSLRKKSFTIYFQVKFQQFIRTVSKSHLNAWAKQSCISYCFWNISILWYLCTNIILWYLWTNIFLHFIYFNICAYWNGTVLRDFVLLSLFFFLGMHFWFLTSFFSA